MNDIRIRQYVDEIFKDVKMTDKALEQKEELTVNITERVRDYMREGLSFDAAFDTAKNIVGDTEELTAPFERAEANRPNTPPLVSSGAEVKPRLPFYGWQLAALSPFIYVLMGFLFGWWAWGWIIIPLAGILGSPIPFWTRIVAMSPFVYVFLGFFFGWWAWAWVIIPMAGILSVRDNAGK